MSRNRVVLTLLGTLTGGTALAEVPRVAVDIAPVHSLVARVMQDVGTPDLILPPGASPHEYSLRPSEARALQDADLVVWMGEGLAPWMEGAVETLAEGATVMTLLEAEQTTLLDFRESALFEAHDHGDHGDHGHGDHDHASEEGHDHDHDHAAEEGHDHDHASEEGHDHDHASEESHDHDHAAEEGHDQEHDHASEESHDHDHASEEGHDHDHDHASEEGHDHDHGAETASAEAHDHDHDHDHAGHSHGAHDPHAWLSPANATAWIDLISAALSDADPANAEAYAANAAAARDEIAALSDEIRETLEPVGQGRFIVFHDAYQYFESHFGISAAGAISLGDASDPSPARIAEIQGRVRDEGIDCVLAEPQYNPGLVETVLEGTEASTGIIDPLGAALEPGADLYPQLLRNMARSLAECL